MLTELHDNIINTLQSSFIPGRNIVDNILVAQKIFHHIRKNKNKKGLIAAKINLEKAYDKVNWNFFGNNFLDFCFHVRIENFILHCVSSSLLSILWNGGKLPVFKPSGGLKQGYRPFLFFVYMEKLSHLINLRVAKGEWHPIKVGGDDPTISHMLFADGVLLFS